EEFIQEDPMLDQNITIAIIEGLTDVRHKTSFSSTEFDFLKQILLKIILTDSANNVKLAALNLLKYTQLSSSANIEAIMAISESVLKNPESEDSDKVIYINLLSLIENNDKFYWIFDELFMPS